MSAEARKKISRDTHRRLRGQLDRGLAAGAAPFGYRTERDEAGGARIVIVLEHATLVRRIFSMYAAGRGIKAIAHELNAERLPAAPRGSNAPPKLSTRRSVGPLPSGSATPERSSCPSPAAGILP